MSSLSHDGKPRPRIRYACPRRAAASFRDPLDAGTRCGSRHDSLVREQDCILVFAFGVLGFGVVLRFDDRFLASTFARHEKPGQVEPRRRAIELFVLGIRADQIDLKRSHQLRPHHRRRDHTHLGGCIATLRRRTQAPQDSSCGRVILRAGGRDPPTRTARGSGA